MSYLLDTDIVIDLLKGDAFARDLVKSLAQSGLAISMVTYMEVYQGIFRDADPVRKEAEFVAFLVDVPVIHFTKDVAQRCAKLREDLRRQRKRVRSRALDLLTAATALEHEYVLVTRNIRDYRDIPDLMLWEEDSRGRT